MECKFVEPRLPLFTSIRHPHAVHYEDKQSLEGRQENEHDLEGGTHSKIVNTLSCRDSQPPSQAQQDREGDCDYQTLLEAGFHRLGDSPIVLLFYKRSHDDDEYDAVEDVYNGKRNQHTDIEWNIVRSTAEGRIK